MIDMSVCCPDVRRWVKKIHDHLKTQEMCNEAVLIDPFSLAYVPDHFKTREMGHEAIEVKPYELGYVSDALKTTEMCQKVVKRHPWCDKYISNRLKQLRCVIGLLKPIHGSCIMFLTVIKHTKCVTMWCGEIHKL